MASEAISDIKMASGSRWLIGPKSDLLFGCGMLYALFFILLLTTGQSIQTFFPLALTPLIALFLSMPHYGSTLLRVYERAEDRQKYRFFSVYLSGAVALWFVVSVYSSVAGTWLLTLYLVWSPWHYMGQNYGIALMFLGRRQITISSKTKRLIHLSFLSSYLLTVSEMQGFPSSAGFYQVVTLELSASTLDVLFAIFGAVYICTTLGAFVALQKRASWTDLVPTALLFFSQALWFLVPLVARKFDLFQGTVALSMNHAIYAFFWIAIAHAIQYLWITSYFATKSEDGASGAGFLGKALLAGALIWVIPVLIFSPSLLGNRGYDAGLAILVGAAVNVHHFILDGAIWKLREGRLASILLRDVAVGTYAGLKTSRSLLKPALLTLGLCCVILHYLGTVTTVTAQQALDGGNLVKATESLDFLETLQRDSASMRRTTAWLALELGNYGEATRQAKMAAHLEPGEANRRLFAQIEKRSQEINAPVLPDGKIQLLAPFVPKPPR